MTNNTASMLAKTALTFPGRPALALGEEVIWTYADFALQAARLAGGLAALGLKPGDKVALAMVNVPEFYEALYGIWHAGLAAVPINAKLHVREFHYILENSGARAVLATAALAEALAPLTQDIESLAQVISTASDAYGALRAGEPAALCDVAPEDLAWLFYTSGTTGRPKGAMLSHRNLNAMIMNYFCDVDTVAPEDAIVHAAPMSHGSGLCGLSHVAKGANNVIPASGGFDPAEALSLIKRWPGTSFFFAPTMVTRLINAPALGAADTANLKTIVYGGGPMYVEDTQKALAALGAKLVQIYGQGEAPMTISYLSKAMHEDRAHPRYLARLGSAGIARTDVDVRIVDGEDRPLPPGEVGEIVCRGDVVMAGYHDNPEATAETLRGGWLHTGDVGSLDSDGFLTLMDRSKDMIISGGSNIYPREVEEVLLRHPGVLECSVVGRPHSDWGEEVVAFVVARQAGAVDAEALDRLCLDSIARFKRPKHYRFVDALAKNNYGKVLKRELRHILAAEEEA